MRARRRTTPRPRGWPRRGNYSRPGAPCPGGRRCLPPRGPHAPPPRAHPPPTRPSRTENTTGPFAGLASGGRAAPVWRRLGPRRLPRHRRPRRRRSHNAYTPDGGDRRDALAREVLGTAGTTASRRRACRSCRPGGWTVGSRYRVAGPLSAPGSSSQRLSACVRHSLVRMVCSTAWRTRRWTVAVVHTRCMSSSALSPCSCSA